MCGPAADSAVTPPEDEGPSGPGGRRGPPSGIRRFGCTEVAACTGSCHFSYYRRLLHCMMSQIFVLSFCSRGVRLLHMSATKPRFANTVFSVVSGLRSRGPALSNICVCHMPTSGVSSRMRKAVAQARASPARCRAITVARISSAALAP